MAKKDFKTGNCSFMDKDHSISKPWHSPWVLESYAAVRSDKKKGYSTNYGTVYAERNALWQFCVSQTPVSRERPHVKNPHVHLEHTREIIGMVRHSCQDETSELHSWSPQLRPVRPASHQRRFGLNLGSSGRL